MTSTDAASNRLHSIDARLCRWLKLIHNRIRRDDFPITREFLGLMLGVRRPTVSTAAKMLQTAGIIKYSRGQITILDARALADGACECLELMESQVDKIFDRPWRDLIEAADDGRGAR
jgi:Mn-dependent DtxR family transcriptional regulator